MKGNVRVFICAFVIALGGVAATQIWAQTSFPFSVPDALTAQTTPTTGTTGGATTGTTGATTGTTGATGATGATTTTTGTTSAAVVVIQQIFETTRAVPAGAAVTAFTVPAGSRLVVTDVILTNTGATGTCTVAIARGATDAAVTGPLCVPARTSLSLMLTTGLEFAAGETVRLAHAPETTGAVSATDTVSVHLRGFLVPAV
jgi:hypothetical protein